MKKTVLVLLSILVFISVNAQKSLKSKLKVLDTYYEKALQEWEVPGMAVAIVKDGEIVFAKGYGYSNLDTKAKTDENTLFAIASNTKAFTASSLAILVDEGKLKWNDKVRKYLPWFELYDPYVSENFTIRDLLVHSSGLKTFSGDLLWYGTNHSREDIVRKAKYLEPSFGYRERWGYSNIMYIAAGLVIEKISGMSWDDFVKQHFFEPLDMTRTITSTHDLKMFDNVSAPHNDTDDGLKTIEWLNWDNVAPAGAIISSVTDVSQWLILQMNKGINGKDTIFTPLRTNEMWAPITPQGVSGFSKRYFPSTHFKAYGLGWSMYDYLGVKVLGHGGGYDGFISNTTFVPEEQLGMVFLTNKNTSLYYPLVYKTLDVMLDNETETDYAGEFLTLFAQGDIRGKQAWQEWLDSKDKDAPPSFETEEYTGTYGGKMYGNAKVYLEGDQLMIHLLPTEIYVGTLTHHHHDTFILEFTDVTSLPQGTCTFILNKDGKIDELKLRLDNPDFDFTELEFKKLD